MNPTWNRTVVVDNMSRNSSIEDVRSKFAVAGKVEHVRMIDAKKVPDDITTYLNVIKNPNRSVRQAKGYTLVEYASAAEAQAACGMLTDETNWRNGKVLSGTPLAMRCLTNPHILQDFAFPCYSRPRLIS